MRAMAGRSGRSGSGRWSGWPLLAALLLAGLLPVAAVVAAPVRSFAAVGDLTVPSGASLYPLKDSPEGAAMVAAGVGSRSSTLALLDTSSGVWSDLALPASPSGRAFAVPDDSGGVVAVFSTGGGWKAFRYSGSWSSGTTVTLASGESVADIAATSSTVYVVGTKGTLAEASWSASSWTTRSMAPENAGSSNAKLFVSGGVAVFGWVSSGSGFRVWRMDLSSGAKSQASLTPAVGGDFTVSADESGAAVIATVDDGQVATWRWDSSDDEWLRRADLVPSEFATLRAAAVGSDGRLHVIGGTRSGALSGGAQVLGSASVDLDELRSWSELGQLDPDGGNIVTVSTPASGAPRPVGVVTWTSSGADRVYGWRGTTTALPVPDRASARLQGSDHKIADVNEPTGAAASLSASLSGNGGHAAVRVVDGTSKVLLLSYSSGAQWTLAEGVPSDDGQDAIGYLGVRDDGTVIGVGRQSNALGGSSRWFRLNRKDRRWVGGRAQTSPDFYSLDGVQVLADGDDTRFVFRDRYVNKMSSATEVAGTEFSNWIDGPSATDGEFVYSVKGDKVRVVPAEVPASSSTETLVAAGPSLTDASIWVSGGSVFVAGKTSSGTVALKRSDDQGATWTVIDSGSSPGFPAGSAPSSNAGPVLGWQGLSQLHAYATARDGSDTVVYRSSRPLTGTGGWSTPVGVCPELCVSGVF